LFAVKQPGINGVVKIGADFSIIDNEKRFKRCVFFFSFCL